jgi:hypothetical protein
VWICQRSPLSTISPIVNNPSKGCATESVRVTSLYLNSMCHRRDGSPYHALRAAMCLSVTTAKVRRASSSGLPALRLRRDAVAPSANAATTLAAHSPFARPLMVLPPVRRSVPAHRSVFAGRAHPLNSTRGATASCSRGNGG